MTDITMKIKFWGVRGSIPTPLTEADIRKKQKALIENILKAGGTATLFPEYSTVSAFGDEEDQAETDRKIEMFLDDQPNPVRSTYGGNTTCIEIQTAECPLIVIDAGTGLRNLGMNMMGRGGDFNPMGSAEIGDNTALGRHVHHFLTHYHWDHIQGFPFFVPAFLDSTTMHLYGKKNALQSLTDVLRGQQEYPNFPVVWDDLACTKEYKELPRMGGKEITLGRETKINYTELTHPDSVFAYSIRKWGAHFVCATDTEHKDSPDPRLVALAQDADVLYYDAQYTPEEYQGTNPKNTKFDWGHSTYEWAIKNALAANVKTVVLGHHDIGRDDFGLDKLEMRAINYANEQMELPENKGKDLAVVMAYESMEIEL